MYNGKLWVTTHSGKLEGMKSIGTSCLDNRICRERAKNENSICHFCYAERLLKCRDSLDNHLKENMSLLRNILPANDLPVVNDRFTRFESFGDVEGANQLINYCNICRKNKDTAFALWSKNLCFMDMVFLNLRVEKPSNMIIVYSSEFLNIPAAIPERLKPYIDHRFTVYEKEYAEKHNITINCGGRKCLSCMLCYHKETTFDIRELKK